MTIRKTLLGGLVSAALMTTAMTGVIAQDATPATPAAPANPEAATPPPMPASPKPAAEMAQPNADMKAVLDALAELEAKPFHTLSVPEARNQASPADAARTVQRDKKIPSEPESLVETKDIAIPGPMGALPARVYMPPDAGEGPLPVIVYFHGGGWVVADINVYDSTPRALAIGSKAIVISVDYRHSPEWKFPAAHDDAWTAYEWVVENIHTMNGDAARIAVAGESAGANLAANVALMAKEREATLPVYQLLVYPIAGTDTETESYLENAEAKPLGKADMEWFFEHVLENPEQASDPRLNLVGRDDLAGLPPATVITAQIDPLRTEGETYAEDLEAADVAVNALHYDGVTHEFFGMAKVVPEAKEAVDAANADLTAAFAQ
ncbi:alpha/beta hydrolase [Devosia sp. BK]|uniref:alpha/beta hydrolase n=1 Tax=Devosia sp. BK TaxID=2871706 RepID=UPI00293A7679|nr:alpha/beta hydrolase [Devosia sp. BK]MDV3249779.1 alpha/beta hydrolase [Devosia sp. BK]